MTQRTSTNSIDLFTEYARLVDNVREKHVQQLDQLRSRMVELETENQRLRSTSTRSTFDIENIPDDSALVQDLKHELDQKKSQISQLQLSLKEKEEQIAEILCKSSIRMIAPEESSSSPSTTKSKEFQRLKEQFELIDQCHYETDEQIRLLKECLFNSDQQNKIHQQSSLVKQSDLNQQTSIVENLLHKQHEEILRRFEEMLDGRSSSNLQRKTKKKKRL